MSTISKSMGSSSSPTGDVTEIVAVASKYHSIVKGMEIHNDKRKKQTGTHVEVTGRASSFQAEPSEG